MTTARLISAASILVDQRMRVPRPPERGGDVLAGAVDLRVAGGFNLMVAAVRQGVDVVHAGTAGTGPYGDLVRNTLRRNGIDAPLLPDPRGDTGICVILVDDGAEKTMVTAPGVEAQLPRHRLDGIPLRTGDLVAISGYDLVYPEMAPVLAGWVGDLPDGIGVVFDPGPLLDEINSDHLDVVLQKTEVLSLTVREAGVLAGAEVGMDAAGLRTLRRSRGLAGRTLLVIRDGERGCAAGTAGEQYVVAPPRVGAVDATGAGDVFTGVLAAGLLQGRSVGEAVARACAAGAFAVTGYGGDAAPTPAEIDELSAGVRIS
ncbi:sugar kinase [Nakamurella sp. YIM 132087]|uniref:Sugar kinase n=1 Tax=Nakamurella alba TaxID=2665158 RepID=A0A7K1FTL9_9ACTN|nr:PfkB family carbohydrate kinase [Nakamurella alba]MTD17468.1 sugar kinase [Nakamurella alba]